MIAGIKIETGSCDPDHVTFGDDFLSVARIWYSLPVCKMWRF